MRRILDELGIDSEPILREAGIDPRLSAQPKARYPFDRVIAAWVGAVRATGDPDLGLRAARSYRMTDFHGLPVSFLASRDLERAYERIARYHAIVNTAVEPRLEKSDDRIDLWFPTFDSDHASQRVQEDSRTAILVDLARQATGADLDPLEVSFTYGKPADRRALDALLRCPLVFGAPQWRLSYTRKDASIPFQASNRELARSHDRILDQVLAKLRKGDLASRVKLAMVEQLASGTPTDSSIAKALLVSTRSLQRHLANEGTSFTELLASVRRELAERYVRDPELPVTEISYMLGFSDVSAFSRAYKRWTGVSPAAYRRTAQPEA